jgi:hypothetical protein
MNIRGYAVCAEVGEATIVIDTKFPDYLKIHPQAQMCPA